MSRDQLVILVGGPHHGKNRSVHEGDRLVIRDQATEGPRVSVYSKPENATGTSYWYQYDEPASELQTRKLREAPAGELP